VDRDILPLELKLLNFTARD